MKHLLKLVDLSKDEIIDLLNFADQLKFEQKHDTKHKYLDGKTLGMIFRKSSTRTRVSFEVGMCQLGGSALFLSASDLQLGRGESIQDTARVLSRYLNGLMVRTYSQEEIETLAKYSSIPVINGLTDFEHPCQIMADLMTIREYKQSLKGLKLCYVGDGNNVANSLIAGGIKTGMEVAIACPENYEPDQDIMKWAKENGRFLCTQSVSEAAKDADVLYTDVWTSMGQEEEAALRRSVLREYQVNDNLLAFAKNDAMVLHCLPAHSEEEITASVFEAHAGEIFDQAENRLHVQKAILAKLIGRLR